MTSVPQEIIDILHKNYSKVDIYCTSRSSFVKCKLSLKIVEIIVLKEDKNG